MDLLTIASGVGHGAVSLAAAEAEPLFQINLFQVLIAAANFVVFLALIWTFAFKPVSKMLADRKTRIEEGLRDAEQARRDRESAETERLAALQEARREANDILARAQKVAQETRDADIAATKADLERIRERASADLEAEKQRAIGELRAEVADLALQAAGRVIGETMTSEREKRLVEQFLAESGTGRESGGKGAGSGGKGAGTGSNA
ncbi:MAG TPA: F0F1 ATP synthase subunit B [Verrucomicrobiae bacterium]|nr:F0F1 ATP synthase subunit B [Verrucomicrobiae bacterium]